MKQYFSSLLLFALLLAFTPTTTAQNTDTQQDKVRETALVMLSRKALDDLHFERKELNDDLSQTIFNHYLKTLDYGKRLLTETDYQQLVQYEHQLDDQIRFMDVTFPLLAYTLLSQRIVQAQHYCYSLLEQPFNYTIEESVFLNSDSITWAKDTTELKERWRKLLKYETVVKISQEMEEQEKMLEKDPETVIKPFDSLELAARNSIRKRYDNFFDYMLKQEYPDFFEDFISAYTLSYDPHTSYFPPKDKEDFDIRFSGKLEGIGATLTNRDGYVTVTNIVPGSPSWKQGELEVDDKIVEVGQGDEEPLNIVDMRVDKAVKHIRGKKGTEVRLTVRKMDGSTVIIPIIRDVVVLEETYAKSLIITDNETNKKIGYIMLPSFYTDFNDSKGRDCAKDVKKELLKLTDEKIDGLIIDLRNNGGGSLTGAVNIAGNFIDKGPVVQVKSRDDNPYIHRDYFHGVIYDGPLAVMVNGGSASASEILAAALQDYNRAVIVGGKSTFGKGTVQRFISYDNTPQFQSLTPLGALKLTISKFYRIDGGATQLKGVTPDIILPDNYAYINYGEEEYDNAMPWSKIEKCPYTVISSNNEVFQKVISESNKRVAENNAFLLIDDNAKRLKNARENYTYPLSFDTYQKWSDSIDVVAEKYESIGKDTLNYHIVTLPQDLLTIEADSTLEKNRKKWIGNLLKDNYLYETVRIVEDIDIFTP